MNARRYIVRMCVHMYICTCIQVDTIKAVFTICLMVFEQDTHDYNNFQQQKRHVYLYVYI